MIVVFEKPNRSSFTFTPTRLVNAPTNPYARAQPGDADDDDGEGVEEMDEATRLAIAEELAREKKQEDEEGVGEEKGGEAGV